MDSFLVILFYVISDKKKADFTFKMTVKRSKFKCSVNLNGSFVDRGYSMVWRVYLVCLTYLRGLILKWGDFILVLDSRFDEVCLNW